MTRDRGGAKAPLNRNVTHYCKSKAVTISGWCIGLVKRILRTEF